jgi:hypothetical protein
VRVEYFRWLQYRCSVFPATASSLIRATADSFTLNVVDVYNGATGVWTTAQLSVARSNLAATSVGNVALFAGGSPAGALLYKEGRRRGFRVLVIIVYVLSICARWSIAVLFSLRLFPL